MISDPFFGSTSEKEIGIQSEKNTQIADTELDSDLKSDRDPIFQQFLNVDPQQFCSSILMTYSLQCLVIIVQVGSSFDAPTLVWG